jgi:hypothetical protein
MAAVTNAVGREPRRWWILVAGAWFALLSQAAIWIMDITLSPARSLHTFETAPLIPASIALTAFIAGAVCWWASVHRRFRLLATAASSGLGTAILTLLLNPFGWALLLPFPGFVYPLVLASLFIVGSLTLKLIFLLWGSVWPTITVERGARRSGARPSL